MAETPTPDVFSVDIGGGTGHQTIDFKKAHPDVGKLIVQDIAPAIDSIVSPISGVEGMVTNFFKPQPIKGPKVYFLAHVLHDWPDNQAKTILEQVRDAIGIGSVYLLSETFMLEVGVSFTAAAMDFTMMTAYASSERTENQFRELLSSAGLELVKVWKEQKSDQHGASPSGQSVLQARLK